MAAEPKVKPIPDGCHTATPYLIVDNAAAALDFYQRAFGATEMLRIPDSSGGKVMHAEFRIGDSIIMMADEFPEMGFRSPKSLGGSASSLMLYVPDVDAFFRRAVAAGGKEVRPVADQFYGDRTGSLEDPFGHQWSIATHTEDVSPEDLSSRLEEMQKQRTAG